MPSNSNPLPIVSDNLGSNTNICSTILAEDVSSLIISYIFHATVNHDGAGETYPGFSLSYEPEFDIYLITEFRYLECIAVNT